MFPAAVLLVADLAIDHIGLTDVGTGAAIGGVIGEGVVRVAPLFGIDLEGDGWREGMFFGALAVISFWVFGELEA